MRSSVYSPSLMQHKRKARLRDLLLFRRVMSRAKPQGFRPRLVSVTR